MENELFYSKILLSGEYIVFLGAKALAVPYKKYSGKLDFISDESNQTNLKNQSNNVIHDLYKYLFTTLSNSVLTNKFNLEEFNNDIKSGLYFDSNIPLGYGVGSSGALTAAIYNYYVEKREIIFNSGFQNEILLNLKNELAYIESFFHGKSSGIDTLVSFLNKPILIQKNSIEVVNYKIENISQLCMVLIDTGQKRNTYNLISRFNKEIETNKVIKPVEKELMPASDMLTKALLESNNHEIFMYIQKVSEFQFDNFKQLIVPEFLNFWERGLKSEKYFLKLCGSGGGGYLLGFINDFEYFNKEVKAHNTQIKFSLIH